MAWSGVKAPDTTGMNRDRETEYERSSERDDEVAPLALSTYLLGGP